MIENNLTLSHFLIILFIYFFREINNFGVVFARKRCRIVACERIANNAGEGYLDFSQLFAPRVRKLRVHPPPSHTHTQNGRINTLEQAAFSFAPLNERVPMQSAIKTEQREVYDARREKEGKHHHTNEPVIRLKVPRSKVACRS